MIAAPDDDTMTVVSMIDANDNDMYTHTLPSDIRPAPPDREADTDDALADDGDEVDDNVRIHSMLRKAAADSDQPSLDNWLLFGFSSKAVEDAYQAGQASGRALGVAATTVLWATWTLLTTATGNATRPEILGWAFPIISTLFLIALAPFAGKPVKHHDLVFLTSCAVATLSCLIQLVAVSWLFIEQGHAIMRHDIMAWTFYAVMPPVFLIMMRPSAWLTSATCIMSGLQVGAIGYYSNMFDVSIVSILGGISFCGTMHMMWFVVESTHRISFVHQLSATRHAEAAREHAEAAMRLAETNMRQSEAAIRQSEVARRSEASASQAINHCAKRVMYGNGGYGVSTA
jgi:hypothetical protein